MTELIDRLLIAFEVSKYPNYSQARAYLVNFLRRGRKAFIRTKRYAYYQHSPSLRVIVIRLVHGIFEVRAYPFDGLCFVTLEEVLKAEDFRAWLFALDYRTNRIYYINGSQRLGIEGYKGVKKAVSEQPKLAKADQTYLSILAQY